MAHEVWIGLKSLSAVAIMYVDSFTSLECTSECCIGKHHACMHMCLDNLDDKTLAVAMYMGQESLPVPACSLRLDMHIHLEI